MNLLIALACRAISWSMSKVIRWAYKPDFLRFRFPFRIAHGERTGTDVVFVTATCDEHCGFGEATLPPYLPYTSASTMQWLQRVFAEVSFSVDASPEEVARALAKQFPGEWPALCAVDTALWQLQAAHQQLSLHTLVGIPARHVPHTFTIGIGSQEEVEKKVAFGFSRGYTLFKLKLDGKNDRNMVQWFRACTDAPFAVDANQAWTSVSEAIKTAHTLRDAGAVLIEQPFHRDDLESMAKLTAEGILPIIADESCQTEQDIARLQGMCDGVNIKLQKCGGLTFALKMLEDARSRGMQVLVGCMSESATGIAPAEVLASLADWADLDGPDLIVESPDPRVL